MGCKCKDTAEKASKYTDEETINEIRGAGKVAWFVRKIVTLVLCVLIIIVTLPIIVLYGLLSWIFGKQAKINLKHIVKKHV